MIKAVFGGSLSSGRMGAKSIIQLYHNEGLAVGRGRQSYENIYSAPEDILSKQCAMGNLLVKSVCLKYVHLNLPR